MSNTTTLESDQGNIAVTQGNVNPDVMEQLAKPDVQAALAVLIDHLPQLIEISTQLIKTYDFTQKVLSDRVLLADTAKVMKELAIPIETKVKAIATAAIEASDRAEQSKETIGLLGMLRLLKNPELQKMLRFGQAYLDILGERKK
ncbi:DUF1641 domain-containing protein [Paenibacillus sp. CF384]|uniref:DUF1641 domain-containing protein n=1 Tax=Paenibacillus sp. CF384 TaxID=1884382 RepID=UPI0008963B8D|nr:DUF1641 domain-containing protein [Paenibacillus sp. CF384]SDW98662.1 Uncharacterized conserved protein YjgD, DUF1641 family [Paenibacillus sp. CF384]